MSSTQPQQQEASQRPLRLLSLGQLVPFFRYMHWRLWTDASCVLLSVHHHCLEAYHERFWCDAGNGGELGGAKNVWYDGRGRNWRASSTQTFVAISRCVEFFFAVSLLLMRLCRWHYGLIQKGLKRVKCQCRQQQLKNIILTLLSILREWCKYYTCRVNTF